MARSFKGELRLQSLRHTRAGDRLAQYVGARDNQVPHSTAAFNVLGGQYCPVLIDDSQADVVPDTDPQGLANSLNAANCSGVISCNLDGLRELKADGLDKPHDYMNQLQVMEGLTRSGHPLALVLGDLRTGFSQESMARRQLKIWCNVTAD